ncbi:MAG: ComF family protein [Blautia sp.]|nr:ComF family protein [Blautia sp.]
MRSRLSEAAGAALNALYPRHCPCCHEILKDQKALICPECRESLSPIRDPRCVSCGRPVREEEELCSDCLRHPHVFDAGRAVFMYDDVWKLSIEKFKYYGCREYGDFYAEAMYRILRPALSVWQPELVIPVPLHPRKKRMRGFNQSWYLAKRLGEKAGIPASEDVVRKIRDTKSQKKLDAAERRRNLEDAFRVTGPVAGRRILVVDDVYTTGSTMDAMASALKKKGASGVCYATFCMSMR